MKTVYMSERGGVFDTPREAIEHDKGIEEDIKALEKRIRIRKSELTLLPEDLSKDVFLSFIEKDEKELASYEHKKKRARISRLQMEAGGILIDQELVDEIVREAREKCEVAEPENLMRMRLEWTYAPPYTLDTLAMVLVSGWTDKFDLISVFKSAFEVLCRRLDIYRAVVDEALILNHIGTAEVNDDRETARRKLADLIDYEIEIATDPNIGGSSS